MRRVLALFAAVVLVLSFAPPAAAANPTGTISVGSYYSGGDEAGLAAMTDYCAAQIGATVTVNPGAFDVGSIETYLQGTPDEVLTWDGSERMRFYSDQGLLTPINDVWHHVGANYSHALRAVSTGSDGRQYLVPILQYPWVVLYRKSVFAEKGYDVPTTLAQFVALAQKMQADGLIPLASADAEGWPAMGMFDILDMRMNGYRFHMGLMAGKYKWTDRRVKAVFKEWASLLPYFQPDAASRHVLDGAAEMIDGQAGMYFSGTFAANATTDPSVIDDLGMFSFPLFGNRYDSENAIDAPLEGLAISTNRHDLGTAKKLLECAATVPAQRAFVAADPVGGIATVKHAETSGYTSYQKEMLQVIKASNKTAQFLDRDSRPDFTGADGMQAFLADFLVNPTQNLDHFLCRIQHFWNSLPRH